MYYYIIMTELNKLNELLENSKYIIVPMRFYKKIIPIDEKMEEYIKNDRIKNKSETNNKK